MYLDYFSIKRHPFRITPDTSLFFSGGDQGRGVVLEAMLYAIQNGEGILKVVGEVGSGKTMLCRMLEERLPDSTEVVYIANPKLSPEEILYAVAFELKLPVRHETPRLLVMQQLTNYLLQQHAANRRVLVTVEEAQSMPYETLEEIRLLSNLETKRDKLLQIILFGQPELDKTLSARNIRQLRERITHSFYLHPLGNREVSEYISFRIGTAGCPCPRLFTSQAEKLIARASRGLTRRINILADKALLAAYSDNVLRGGKTVTPGMRPLIRRRHVLAAIGDSDYPLSLRYLLFTPLRLMSASMLLILAAVGFTLWPPASGVAGTGFGQQLRQVVAALYPAETASPFKPERQPLLLTTEMAPLPAAGMARIDAPTLAARQTSSPVALSSATSPADEPDAGPTPGQAAAFSVAGAAAPPAARTATDRADADPAPNPALAPPANVAAPHPDTGSAAATGTVATGEPATVLDPAGDSATSPAATEPGPDSAWTVAPGPAVTPVAAGPDTGAEPVTAASASAAQAPAAAGGGLTRQRLLASADWLLRADPDSYTVQFITDRMGNLDFAETILEILQREGLLEQSYLCITRHQGTEYWTIKHGNFAGLTPAQKFVGALPSVLGEFKPFVQNMSAVECNTNPALVALLAE